MSLAHSDLAFVSAHTNRRRGASVIEGRALVRLAAPIMLIGLVNMAMSLTDAAMVARYFGTGAFAAVAVGSDLYSIVFYLGAGVLGGLAPFYAGAFARADDRERAKLARIGWLTVGLLTVATVPVVWSAPAWLAHLGLDPSLLEAGAGYTRAMALTLVPMLGVALYRTILTAAEKPRVFLKVTLAMVPLNATANYVLMLGVGPLPALGPAGAGFGSVVVATASLGLLMIVARAQPRATPAAVDVGWRDFVAVLRVGLPIGIATVAEVGVFLGATLYAATLGAADVAAHTLTLRTAGLAYAVPTALLQASMVRLARADSQGEPDAAHAVVRGGLALSLAFGTAIFALNPLILLGLLELVANPGLAAAGLLRGRKDTRAPMTYVLVGYWAVGAPLGLALSEVGGFGITGVWIGLAAGTTVTTALTLLRLMRLRLQSTQRTRPAGFTRPGPDA
jgi:multidrug resistance protein, MATE family